MRKHTINDEIFYNLYGFYPKKAGKAYEALATASYAIAVRATHSQHDQYVEGLCTRVHQLDGVVELKDESVVLEAKDYTDRKSYNRVGSGDVEKFSGGLSDLDDSYSSGVFASATDFSDDAALFAEGTLSNIRQKHITLLDIRKAVFPEDLKNRLLRVKINFHIRDFDYQNMQFNAHFSDSVNATMNKDGLSGAQQWSINALFDCNGVQKMSITDLLEQIPSPVHSSDSVVKGTIMLDKCYIKCHNGLLYPIQAISYNIPIVEHVESSTIEAAGKPIIFIASKDNSINKLITDRDLISWGKEHKIETSIIHE